MEIYAEMLRAFRCIAVWGSHCKNPTQAGALLQDKRQQSRMVSPNQFHEQKTAFLPIKSTTFVESTLSGFLSKDFVTAHLGPCVRQVSTQGIAYIIL